MSESDHPIPNASLALTRAAIGLAQGLALYVLVQWDDELQKALSWGYGTAVISVFFLPAVLLGALAAVRRTTLIRWLGIAAITVIGLSAYQSYFSSDITAHFPAAQMVIFTGAGLFIAHGLVLAADEEGRWLAPYARYFDIAWKDAVRLALAVAFVGALWIVLFLGAALFDLIGIKQVKDLISKPWFVCPGTATFFALAIHLTDVRVGLVRGVRTLVLTLLSWLLPVMTVLAVGFLAALPFTGLTPLWATRSAAGILLAAAAALIVLINAAYQEGEAPPQLALRWAARVAAVAIGPLIVIAAYGVILRTSQYGLTPDRIYALACLAVGASYGVGYTAAAFWPGTWMRKLETSNIATAHLVLVVLLAIFSPLADPVRLSIKAQVHRLESGVTSPDKFDFNFLRFEAGPRGEDALRKLVATSKSPVIVKAARAALARKVRYEPAAQSPDERAKSIRVIGAAALPESFMSQVWTVKDQDPLRGCSPQSVCTALYRDLDGDGQPEIIFLPSYHRTLYRLEREVWVFAGELAGPNCGKDLATLSDKDLVAVAPERAWRDLMVGGARLRVVPDTRCGGFQADPVDGVIVPAKQPKAAKH